MVSCALRSQVYAADCRRSMIARTSSILSSAMRSTGLAPSRSRWGLNSQTRAASGGYTWASWPANHSSRRSRSRLFGRGVDLPVVQRETVCGVVSRSCAISRALMPPDCLMLSSFRATGTRRMGRCVEHRPWRASLCVAPRANSAAGSSSGSASGASMSSFPTRQTADQRDPCAWKFYVVRQSGLPEQRTIGLKWLRSQTSPCGIEGLATAVGAIVGELRDAEAG